MNEKKIKVNVKVEVKVEVKATTKDKTNVIQLSSSSVNGRCLNVIDQWNLYTNINCKI